jgi:cell division protein ZapA (FtsZ GTPase activity inhibitor)
MLSKHFDKKTKMEDLIPISITIADRTYRIKVAPKDEEMVRKTIKFLNDKVLEFKSNFAGKDMQDYVSMVMAWYATQPQATIAENLAQDTLQEELDRIEGFLDKSMHTS